MRPVWCALVSLATRAVIQHAELEGSVCLQLDRLPTNSQGTRERPLTGEAKAAILAGDRGQAVRLLDGLQNRRVEGCEIPAVLVHALVATAREDYGRDISDREALLAVQRAHTALRQILQWIGASPF